jgi:hypothetical protein
VLQNQTLKKSKKMVETFGAQYAAARVEGVLWLMTPARISLGMHESNRVNWLKKRNCFQSFHKPNCGSASKTAKKITHNQLQL